MHRPFARNPAAAFLSLVLTSAAFAQESPSTQPYQLRIVIHFAENRFLTPSFKEQVAQTVNDHLQLTCGRVAEIEVVSHHPLLAAVKAKGLQQALDGWDELSEVQTHFVLIDFVAGRYTVGTRLHDGFTGVNSPRVRSAATSDRRQVGALAAQLLDAGVGIAGVVTPKQGGVEVTLQAGELGTLDRWVKPGQIFAVTRIIEDSAAQRSVPHTWAVLRITSPPKQGVCRGAYFCRYVEDSLDTSRPQVAGYRCLKLNAAACRVNLRFIDAVTLRPLSGLQVHIGRHGFDDTVRELTTDSAGLIETSEKFDGVAFVKVVSGGTVRARFPVVLAGEETIVCRLKLEQSESLALLHYRRDEWLRRVFDALLVTSARINNLHTKLGQSLDDALVYARAGLNSIDKDIASLDLERRGLQRHADASKQSPRIDFSEADGRFAELRRRRNELADFIGRLAANIRESKSDRTLGLLKVLERARLLETQAEYDQALALYADVLKNNPGQTKVQQHVARLRTAWAAKGKEHEEARQFIYQTWPGLDIPGLKANLEKARQALRTCLDQGDRLSPRKLLHANLRHAANLKNRLTVLQRQEGQSAPAEARTIAEVADGLRQLHEDASKACEAGEETVCHFSSANRGAAALERIGALHPIPWKD